MEGGSKKAVALKDLDLLDMIVQGSECEELFGLDVEGLFGGTVLNSLTRFQTLALLNMANKVHS